MLRLIKRHTKACNDDYREKYKDQIEAEKKTKNRPEDYSKCDCTFVAVGPNPIYDPTSSDPRRNNPRYKKTLDTAVHTIAIQKLRDIEHDLILNPDKPKEKTLAYALKAYREEKKGTSRERRSKIERIVFRRQVLFLALRYGLIDEATRAQIDVTVRSKDEEAEREKRIYNIAAQIPISKPENLDVDAYILTFGGKISAKKDNRSLVMSFWFWCSLKKLRPDNIGAKAVLVATSVQERREKNKRIIPTFTPEELKAFVILLRDPQRCAKVLQRENEQDPEASEKTRYLGLVQVESAMALVDNVTLAGDELLDPKPDHPGEIPIVHERWKTGQHARPFISMWLAEELRTKFKWDSEKYPFWSGEGDPGNRGKTYRERLKKLFVEAGVRVYKRMKKKKSGGKTKAGPEEVQDSHADPHFWRHTWVRDTYIAGESTRDIASWLGDTEEAVAKYYSTFDELRHQHLGSTATSVRALRPILHRAA